MSTITVYSKPNCVQCTATTNTLDKKGIDYNVIDLTQDESAMDKVKELGYRQAPVVVASESNHWAGFNPAKIDALTA